MTATQSVATSTPAKRSSARATKVARGRDGAHLLARWLGPVVVLAAVLLAWWLATRKAAVSPLILPRPGDVVSNMWQGFVTDRLWIDDLWVTLFATIKACVIGLLIGMVTGIIFAFFTTVRAAFYPYVLALQAFPKVAIAPLLVTTLGYGEAPKIVIGAALAFFPVLTATQAGLLGVNKDELNLLRSMRASKVQELRYLRIPNAMSYLFPSLDVAVIMALLGVVLGEIVGSRSGLGYMIQARTAFGDTASVYGILITLAVIGIGLRSVAMGIRKVLPRSVVPR